MLIVALLAGLNFYVDHMRAQRDKAQNDLIATTANLNTATLIVREQQAVLGQIVALRQIDAEVLSTLTTANEKLTQRMAARATVITKLENDHVEVKSYLSTPVPDNLRGVLNVQLAKYRGADEAGQSVPTRAVLEKATTTASR